MTKDPQEGPFTPFFPEIHFSGPNRQQVVSWTQRQQTHSVDVVSDAKDRPPAVAERWLGSPLPKGAAILSELFSHQQQKLTQSNIRDHLGVEKHFLGKREETEGQDRGLSMRSQEWSDSYCFESVCHWAGLRGLSSLPTQLI